MNHTITRICRAFCSCIIIGLAINIQKSFESNEMFYYSYDGSDNLVHITLNLIFLCILHLAFFLHIFARNQIHLVNLFHHQNSPTIK